MVANAFPAKRFFVEMLVRDIELRDAILDLMDNCVDGAMRCIRDSDRNDDKPYDGYQARIRFNKGAFSIEDNCGGIDRDTAEKSAFRLGRQSADQDPNIPTVGLYGIGMKRAIFKMGSSAEVKSTHKDSCFSVNISREWMESDEDWNLPVVDAERGPSNHTGTQIVVRDIRPNIAESFESKTFETDLIQAASAYYSYIIDKGFSVEINGHKVTPKKIALIAEKPDRHGEAIAPYVYKREDAKDGVGVLLTVGLYRPLPTEDEEEEQITGRASSESAGWTVICNDRVITFADKTRATGWGESNVPNYHTQFVAISGVVIFRSNDPSLLPLTTTKRGVDGNSELYLQVKDFMREGLRLFTSYTNRWKKRADERKSREADTKTVLPEDVLKSVKLEFKPVRRDVGGEKSLPKLPAPQTFDDLWIRFSKPKQQIDALGFELFGPEAFTPSELGAACFDKVYGELIK